MPRLVFLLCPLATVTLGIAAAGAATLTTVDSGPVAGRPSLAIGADGLPVIAYETLSGRIRVAKCENWDCTQAMRIDIGDPPTGISSGRYTSIAITRSGNPQVAFKDTVDRQLKLVRCTTPDCTGGQFQFRTIDPGPNDVGAHVAMALDPDGRPAFAYQDFNAAALMLARCTTPGCGTVDIETLRDGGSTYGMDVSIVFAGRTDPAVSGRWSNPAGDSAINFFDCLRVPCADSVQQIHYTIGHPRGIGAAMAIGPDDRPVLSYQDQTENTLRYARCSAPDCNGIEWLTALDVGSLGIGPFTAIAVRPDGRPVIAYQKNLTVLGGASALYVAECADPDCDAFELLPIDVPAPGFTTGTEPAMVLDNLGHPVIAYFDQSALELRLARCNGQTCAGPGDRLFYDGFE